MDKNIDPQKFYTPTEIAEQNLFPWISHEKSIRNWLSAEYDKGNKWRLIRKGSGTGARWFVPGKSIIKILANFDDGSLFGGK